MFLKTKDMNKLLEEKEITIIHCWKKQMKQINGIYVASSRKTDQTAFVKIVEIQKLDLLDVRLPQMAKLGFDTLEQLRKHVYKRYDSEKVRLNDITLVTYKVVEKVK